MTEAEHELYSRGVDARLLLENDTVVKTIADISMALKEAMASTQPNETVKRESYYYTHHALTELVNMLNSYVMAKDQMDEMKAAEEDPQDDMFDDDELYTDEDID